MPLCRWVKQGVSVDFLKNRETALFDLIRSKHARSMSVFGCRALAVTGARWMFRAASGHPLIQPLSIMTHAVGVPTVTTGVSESAAAYCGRI